MWLKYEDPNGNEGILCIDDIRNISKVSSNHYECWFKNLNAYQKISKKSYDKLIKYMGENIDKPEVDKTIYLI